ncbi:hypothetical protein V6N13_076232 [Hibiscus sabdariffa]
MPHGSLEVFLVSAKGFEDMDVFGQGSEPVWNENFVFNVSEELKIMDSDVGSQDFVGEAEAVFREGNIPPTAYNVAKDKEFKGEIKVGLTFTPEGHSSPVYGRNDESYGGWKQSSHSERDRNSSDDERDEGRGRGKSHGRRRHSSDED